MELYLIRHAQSTNNALLRTRWHERSADAPLTELGQRQAIALARHLAHSENPGPPADDARRPRRTGYTFTRLYCSPMERALQTTQPVTAALGLAPEVWVDIHEHGGVYLDHGPAQGPVGYPGKTRQAMLAEFPGYLVPAAITEQGWWHGGYEDRAACYGRAMRVVAHLWQRAETDDRIALITHGGFMDALLKAFCNMLPGRGLFFNHWNTAISRLDLRADGHLNIRYLNRIDHLPQEDISL